MKRLLLCRHAKSSWKEASLSDIERPLNKRGKRNAPEMGKRLAGRGILPDLIASSPAKRAQSTARRLAKKLDYPKNNIVIIDSLYGASIRQMTEIVRGLDNSFDTVYLVGHNPEITIFANYLGRLNIDNVPTCGVVALELNAVSWCDVDKDKGKLIFFDYPRKESAS